MSITTDKMKQIISTMPEGKEKEQAKQGLINIATFEAMADALEKILTDSQSNQSQ